MGFKFNLDNRYVKAARAVAFFGNNASGRAFYGWLDHWSQAKEERETRAMRTYIKTYQGGGDGAR